ncbi:hypothetical protein NVP1236O_03 [Vibrio phage 1.236.O._10N.261.52.C4]|nr:hypothetical protein NVP1236O_03 [Vibrio phage 1.236.O._10N.261.52.C4]
MTTYNTYQEAKVANPKGDIYKLDRQGCFVCSEHGGVEVVMFTDYDSIGVKCSHEDYCMTVEEFLADGHKFFDGDKCIDEEGYVIALAGHHTWGQPDGHNEYRYVLRAAALEEKPKPTKFVKVEESIFDLKNELERGELYYMNMAHYNKCEAWQELAHFMIEGELYRQVEIDWRDEVRAKYPAIDFRDVDGEGYHDVGSWDSDSFIRLCHLVASLTENPTN